MTGSYPSHSGRTTLAHTTHNTQHTQHTTHQAHAMALVISVSAMNDFITFLWDDGDSVTFSRSLIEATAVSECCGGVCFLNSRIVDSRVLSFFEPQVQKILKWKLRATHFTIFSLTQRHRQIQQTMLLLERNLLGHVKATTSAATTSAFKHYVNCYKRRLNRFN